MRYWVSITLVISLVFALTAAASAQEMTVPFEVSQKLTQLIDHYSKAREERDTLLLKEILTNDIDQLVSSGEWRLGIGVAIEGMQRSSATNEGTRTLAVERIRLINPSVAVIDARYTIEPEGGLAIRRMWSTFIAVEEEGKWRIAGIRNMLPSGTQ
ncbi:hypothetical protein ADIS_2963 [Lunatimonas lonarensis]|uniref:DUF4440 domain-containing protein n=1 Tax=Lunatimonas lonarensis TaxID=1232681 RepID=R7ZR29_9BACT|nr:DUF4440 domain-containing protein [Lunatimonas lonarensis]EON76513.1 hypothetical protein ADIS_2963 [Lunatimonas lonarensis]